MAEFPEEFTDIGRDLVDGDILLVGKKKSALSRIYTYLVSKGLAVAANVVPTSRALSGASPIRVGGGASADLSANRTISILAASASNDGSMSAGDFSKLAGMRNPARAIFAKAGVVESGTTSYVVIDASAWSEELDTHSYWSQPTSGSFAYGDVTARTFVVRALGRVNKSTAADEIRIAVHKNGTMIPAESNSTGFAYASIAGQYVPIGLVTTVTVANGDVIDLRVRSGSATNTIGIGLAMELEEVVS